MPYFFISSISFFSRKEALLPRKGDSAPFRGFYITIATIITSMNPMLEVVVILLKLSSHMASPLLFFARRGDATSPRKGEA